MSNALFCPLAPAWGDIGTWVAGLGSLLAVIVALHLSRTADKPKAKGSFGTFIFPPDMTDITMFTIYNLGTHPLVITSCFIEFGGLSRRFVRWPAAVANNWVHWANSPLPYEAKRGDSFRYGTAGEPFAKMLGESKLPAWLVVRVIRVGVGTPWGPIYLDIDKDMRATLRKQVVAHRQAAQTPAATNPLQDPPKRS